MFAPLRGAPPPLIWRGSPCKTWPGANLAEWTELIPGYMHIRFEIDSLVSERSDPDDDIIDRTDRYYVYLKPHGADDNAIRRRMNTKGDPPVYMPMPPH